MKPEEFKEGVKFRYMGDRHSSDFEIIQTVISVTGKYGVVKADCGTRRLEVIHLDGDFDSDSDYARDCELVAD